MRRYAYAGIVFAIILSVILFGCKTKPSVEQPVVTTSKRILGVCARWNANYQLIKDAGIGWVRLGFAFPFEEKVGGKLSAKFLTQLEEAKKVRQTGLRIMGITPLPGSSHHDEKDKKTAWRHEVPAWAGPIDRDNYYDTYERGCEELGRQTKGIVDMWQVSNEMDIEPFRGPLSIEQAERFLTAGVRGVKKGNPEAKASINIAFFDSGEKLFWDLVPGWEGWSKPAERLFRDLYSKPDTPFDYAGIDGYYGSIVPGGPGNWLPVIEKIHEITGKQVLIHEFGFSSFEGSGKPLKQKVEDPVCAQQKWDNEWRMVGHSPEEQAAYVQIALKMFGTYPNVAGCFFYEWEDDLVCGDCGNKGCPRNTAWGLVDSQGKPKPAYYIFKSMAREFF